MPYISFERLQGSVEYVFECGGEKRSFLDPLEAILSCSQSNNSYISYIVTLI